MKKIVLLILLAALASQAGAVRYGLKKQVPIDSVTVIPEYLAYSPASHRMYCGGTWSGRVYWFDCSSDEPQGQVPGAMSPAPMVYDSVNDRVYYKGGNEYFYAIDCAANALDTSWGGYQGGTLAEYNAVSNKIYLWDDFLDQTLIHSAATYAYQGMISPWKGAMHHFGPTNRLYVPHAWLDSLGVFDGASDARVTSIYLPGPGSNFNEKMASSPGSSRLYLSLPNTDQVAVVNTATNTLENVLAVGDNPVNFALCPLNNRMFIACNGSSQHSLQFINLAGVLDSVAVGDSVSVVAYNPTDSLIYIGCQRTGQIKLVDPRLPTPLVVDSISVEPNLRYADIKVDQDGDVYCIASNYSDMFVVGKIPQRIWQCVSPGFWSEYWTWDYSDDGGFSWTGNAMMLLPNAASDSLIFIPSGYSVDVDYAVTVDQLVINGGLNINADVTVSDGPGTDLQVDGYLQRQGGAFTVMPGASLAFGPFSNYMHQMDGDTIPAASWDSLSTIFITGVMSNTPAGMDQAFGDIVWDCFQQAGDHVLPGGPSFSMRDLSVQGTGPGVLILTSPTKPELDVQDLRLYGANALLGSGGNRKLHVRGELEIYDPGWLYLNDSLSPGIDTLFLYGNYFHTLAGIAGGGPDSTAIVFCGADTQRYDGQGEMLTGYIDYVVFPGSHLLMPEWNVLGQGSLGDFKLMAGATLSYSDMFGLYPTGWDEGVIRNQGSREYSQGADYRIYSWGTGPYHAGPGLPDTVNQLIIESYGDQVYLDKDLAVMDTLKLLSNYLNLEGHRLSLFGPILQTFGNLVGDGACQLAVMGGDPSPLSLPGQFRDAGTLTINRPAVITLSDTLLVHSRLELVNGTLDNGGNKLTFQNTASIFRSGTSGLAGAGPVVFVNQVGLEYGAGTVTAGPEMPQGTWGISYLTIKGANDTLIVNNDTISISTSLSLPGGLVFNGRYFSSNGMIDTVGPAGELIVGDSCQVNFNSSYVLPAQLPGITGGSLFLNSIYGNIMRRDIICPGRFYTASDLNVAANTLTLGDSLNGPGLLITDSTSSLVFKGQPVGQVMASTINNLSKLAWDRPATLLVASPLAVHDSLKLGQGSVDNSANLSLKAGAAIFRNSGILAMAPLLEGAVDVVYGSHGGGSMAAGNELPANVTDLNNLTLSLGLMSNDTITLAGSVTVNGRLGLEQGVLAVGPNTLTLRDTIALLMGRLEADSLSNLWLIGCPYNFPLPGSIARLGTLTLESPAGLTVADSLYIRGNYRQFSGHLLGGKLYYGPTATLSYNNTGLDTTSDREFPIVGGPRNLMVSLGGTLYLHDSRLVPGELTLASPLNTGASTITIDSFGVVSGGSFVEGNLAKLIPVSGDTSITYELGTAAGGSSPVAIRAFTNTVPAFITAGIKGAGHPLVSDPAACLNKYWTFSGTGLGADVCQITLNYLPGDFNGPGFDEALHEAAMAAGRYDPPYSAWQLPGIIARNAFGINDGGSIVLAHPGNFNDSPEFTLGRDSAAIVNQAGDLTPPYIVSTQPAAGAASVSLTAPVRVVFSEPIDPAGFAYSFTPNPGGLAVAWSADSLEATISHNEFLADSLYLVEISSAADTSGNPLVEGPAPNPWSFRTASLPIVASTAWQGGTWRLFSAPVAPVDNSADINLGDDFGAFGPDKWLMYGYQPAADSFIARPGLVNGQGYWLASVNSAGIDIYGYRVEDHRTVALQAGWNLVGCPFQDPVAAPMIEVIDSSGTLWSYSDTSGSFFVNDSLVRQRMWTYNDQSYDLVNNGAWDSLSAFDSTSRLMPWQGYAVYAARPCSLFMMPGYKSAGKAPAAPQAQVLWQLELSASSGGAADRGLRVGLSPQAKDGYDRLDAEKPPLVSSRVAASIPHPEWGGPCQAYHYDFRPPAEHIEWPLSIKTSGPEDPADLSYRLSAPLPVGYGLYLVDRRTGRANQLEEQGRIGFSGSREFSVVYTNRGLEGLSLTPLRFDLNRAYPNPFSGSITVNYQLAEPGRVSLKIYNVAGQLVKTLAEGQALPGYYSRTWDGRDNAGRRISSGVYIVRLESGQGLATRKLVKIK